MHWREINETEVRQAIAGTLLGKLNDVFASVTKPSLPIEISLPKALALCGTALSQPVTGPTDPTVPRQGIQLSRVKILSAGGQALNIWALISAPSSSGKDIGNVLELVARQNDWLIGNSGSAEGLADEFEFKGSGLMVIGELAPYLERKTWQAQAAHFLTFAFNKGFFQISLSKRASSKKRESLYCFPNIVAYVQPAVLEWHLDPLHTGQGFLPRFLITEVKEEQFNRPVTEAIDLISSAANIIVPFTKVAGSITIPEGYMQATLDEIKVSKTAYAAVANRYVNEYGPRIATILTVDNSTTEIRSIPEDAWDRATILVKWFFRNAVEVLSKSEGNAADREKERRVTKIHSFICRHPQCTSAALAHGTSGSGIMGPERHFICTELEDRGLIVSERVGGVTVWKPVPQKTPNSAPNST